MTSGNITIVVVEEIIGEQQVSSLDCGVSQMGETMLFFTFDFFRVVPEDAIKEVRWKQLSMLPAVSNCIDVPWWLCLLRRTLHALLRPGVSVIVVAFGMRHPVNPKP